MNFLINTYYVYVRKHGPKGIEASIYGLTIPLTFNFITLFTFVIFYFRKLIYDIDIINFISGTLMFIVSAIAINEYLERRYLKSENFVDLHLPKVFYIFAPVHYLISVLLFVVSLRYS